MKRVASTRKKFLLRPTESHTPCISLAFHLRLPCISVGNPNVRHIPRFRSIATHFEIPSKGLQVCRINGPPHFPGVPARITAAPIFGVTQIELNSRLSLMLVV